jgi:hypothetical protein
MPPGHIVLAPFRQFLLVHSWAKPEDTQHVPMQVPNVGNPLKVSLFRRKYISSSNYAMRVRYGFAVRSRLLPKCNHQPA